MDQPLRIIVTLLCFPLAIYLVLFPPRIATAIWRALFETPVNVELIQQAFRKRTLRPDPFGDESLSEWLPTPYEQLLTRTLLLRRLPPELVLEILNLAEYNTPVHVISSARKSVANGSLRYLASHPLPDAGRLEEVRIALRGRDQGWSSFPELHGTYEGSSSYYEIYLLRRISASPPRSGETTHGRTRSNPWTFPESSAMVEGLAKGEHVEVEVSGSRRTIQYNVHAGQYFKIHLHCFHKDDPILRLAQPGDVLAIDIVARYQGWVNAVNGARITFFFNYAHGPRPRLDDQGVSSTMDERS